MKTNLIIGAGQLGSRHLQGLLKVKEPQTIFVVDPSPGSLNVAEQRSKEMEHSHQITFLQHLNSIPENIDLAIIATNSDVREAVVNELMNVTRVKYLVLEKVLFDNIAAYDNIAKKLEENEVATWVNHPRRIFPHYKEIKREIDFSKNKNNFQVSGANWGLACNGLHFLDLFSFLTDAPVVAIDTSALDKEITGSKRKGFIEFSGTLKGSLADGSTFQIASLKDSNDPILVTMELPEVKCVVTESGVGVDFSYNRDSSKNSTKVFKPMFQSDLTTTIATSLFETGDCALPSFKEAAANHIVFMNSLLAFRNNMTGENSDKLKIT